MKYLKPSMTIILTTAWIGFSEFLRNQIIFKSLWADHYSNLRLDFPQAPINGAIWGLWSLLFAISIYIIATKFTLVQTALLSWLVGFVLMWVTIGNLGVLPYKLLIFAVPLSLLESFVATWIIKIRQ